MLMSKTATAMNYFTYRIKYGLKSCPLSLPVVDR